MSVTVNLGWPQWVWLFSATFSIVYAAVHNGEEQPKRSVWTTFWGVVFALGILWAGGFFG